MPFKAVNVNLQYCPLTDDKEPKMSEQQKLVCPLKINLCKLSTIRSDHSSGGNEECMRRVIIHRLKSSPTICWERIISALETIDEMKQLERIM